MGRSLKRRRGVERAAGRKVSLTPNAMTSPITMLAILWAFPWTLFGLALGLLGIVTGGKGQRVGKVFEFHGGVLTRLLMRAPLIAGAAAITFGHTVLGRTQADLDFCRTHELVHVGQYERWGLFFIPAYLLCSLAAAMRGKHPYWDNPFEREAYAKEYGENGL
jgi:hypothetical protein